MVVGICQPSLGHIVRHPPVGCAGGSTGGLLCARWAYRYNVRQHHHDSRFHQVRSPKFEIRPVRSRMLRTVPCFVVENTTKSGVPPLPFQNRIRRRHKKIIISPAFFRERCRCNFNERPFFFGTFFSLGYSSYQRWMFCTLSYENNVRHQHPRTLIAK
jgi:hypothetical protein